MDKDRLEASAPTGVTERRRVLLVDDNIPYRQVLSQILTEEGWDVIEALTADDALEASSLDTALTLLVTDIDLGLGMDGWALGRLVRNRWPGIGLLFISGENQPGGEDHDLFSEAFLLKPIRMSDFLTAVRTVTAGVAPIPGTNRDDIDITMPTCKQPKS